MCFNASPIGKSEANSPKKRTGIQRCEVTSREDATTQHLGLAYHFKLRSFKIK